MMCKETVLTQNNPFLQQQGDLERFPITSAPKSSQFAMDAFEHLRLKSQAFTSSYPMENGPNCHSDLFEPLPLTVKSLQDQTLSFPSYISLARAKVDSLPEIEDDAILFDRLAEVCNLSRDSAKRAVPMQTLSRSEEPLRKRRRHEEVDVDSSEDETAPRFRPYQQKHWDEQFECLLIFRQDRGHCCVPHDYENNKMLSRWVRRQRYQYKLKQEGKKSTMTDARILKLDAIGFVWDSHAATWSERLSELTDYLRKTGNCNVPATYPPNAPLSTWVKCQRRQYKLFMKGQSSNMTVERIKALDDLGFEWDRSNGKRNKPTTSSRPDLLSGLTEEL